jgi:predicted ABC-class ATPase
VVVQALVRKDREPITPFISKIRALSAMGVSSILVMGGSGDYFAVSDTVISMDCYRAADVTQQAHAINRQFAGLLTVATDKAYGSVTSRRPVAIYPGPPAGKTACVSSG